VFRYSDRSGKVDAKDYSTNVNGSCNAIAGICNRAGNVVGLMPHPERAAEALVGYVGGDSGLAPFKAAVGA
jgi:phosphoribosylformylglycinamidine synthase